MTFDEVLEKCRREAQSAHEKGARFEELIKKFLQMNPQYRKKFSEVWMWKEFPWREEFGGRDVGIDIVAQTTGGVYWAVQCKCYAEASRIDKAAVNSFLATSSKKFSNGARFSERLWISTQQEILWVCNIMFYCRYLVRHH